MNEDYLEQFIENALNEDIGIGDHSSLSCIPEAATGKAKLLVKQAGIIAGVKIAERVFKKSDNKIILDIKINDGERITPGQIVFLLRVMLEVYFKPKGLF
jgi:nicotinate-nucleotide pyrophosphorylase (carboxylating)